MAHHASRPNGTPHVLDLRRARLGGIHLFAANDPVGRAAQGARDADVCDRLSERALEDAVKFARGLQPVVEA